MTEQSKDTPHVLLFHGIGLSRWWMKAIEWHLKRSGFAVRNVTYPSTKHDIDTLAKDFIRPEIEDLCAKANTVYMITHSMGGIVTRAALQSGVPKNLKKIVMIAPPNKGSQAADVLKNWRLFKWYFGPAGQQLVTDPETSKPLNLNEIDLDIGVIAGRQHRFHLYFGSHLPKPNDGFVTVESTKLSNMNDHITLNRDHSTMVFSCLVAKQAIHYLKNGYFKRVGK